MKRPILLLAFGIVGLIAAPIWAAPVADVWYVNAGGGPGMVHFSVTSPGPESHFERAWFGWVWREGSDRKRWPRQYPAEWPFDRSSVMREISAAALARSKSGTAKDLRFPPVGVGPGKELWLLSDRLEAPEVVEWEGLLDAVESAYRQVDSGPDSGANPLGYRRIGKLGGCEIYSVPTLPAGGSALDDPWKSLTFHKAAPPQREDVYDGAPSGAFPTHDVHVRRYLRWADRCEFSGEAVLQLFPIFEEADRYFLEISQVPIRQINWRDISPSGWSPGSRQLALLTTPEFDEPEQQQALHDDLCLLDEFERLCADDKAMRERLYLADPGSNIPPDRQNDLRTECEALLGQGQCPEDAFDLQEGVYRRTFRGNFKLSDKPEIWSELSENGVSWRFDQGSSRERPIRLRRIGADDVMLEGGSGSPGWAWIPIAVIAVSATSAVVSALLLIKFRKRRQPPAANKGKRREVHDPGSSQPLEGKPRNWWRKTGWRKLFLRTPEGKEPANGGTPPEAPVPEPAKLGPEIEAQIKTLVQSALAGLPKGGTTELKQSLESHKLKVEELDRQVQTLSKGPRSIDSRLTDLRTSLKEELRRELSLDQKIEDARKKIRDAGADEKAAFLESARQAKEDSKAVQKGVLSRISEERDQTLRTIGEEAKKRMAAELEKIQDDLRTRARDVIAASRKEVLSDFKAAARDEISGVVNESWRPYASLVEKIEPWFQEERERLDRVAEVLALFDRVPNLGAHLEILAERLPYEGFLSAVVPEHLDFPLAFRQQTDEEGRKLYEKLNREIGSLEPASERESLDRSFEALGQLGLWIQALWGAMRVWGSFRDILETLPEPARQEWLSAFKFLRSFEVVDAVAFRRIARQRSGILDSAPVTRAEIDFLKRTGLLSREKGLKDRLRLYLVPPGEPGHLGQACLALQYLVEAFPIEQIRDPARYEEFSMRLRRAAETAGWPADFHSLIESAAAGAGLRYAAVPYYDSLVGDSRYRFIKQSIDVVDLVEKTGRSLPSLDPKAVVRLLCPFFFQEELFYAGRAGIARQ